MPDGFSAFSDPRGGGSWALLERGEPGEIAALLVLDQEATLRSTTSVGSLLALVAARAGGWTEVRVLPSGRYCPVALAAVGLTDVGTAIGGSARLADPDVALGIPNNRTPGAWG